MDDWRLLNGRFPYKKIIFPKKNSKKYKILMKKWHYQTDDLKLFETIEWTLELGLQPKVQGIGLSSTSSIPSKGLNLPLLQVQRAHTGKKEPAKVKSANDLRNLAPP